MTLSNQKGVLFWSTGGYQGLLCVEVLVATALRLRGQSCYFVVCDGVAPACASRFDSPTVPRSEWSQRCAECTTGFQQMLRHFSLPYCTLGQMITQEEAEHLQAISHTLDSENVLSLVHEGISLGRNIRSGVVRQTRSGDTRAQADLYPAFGYTALCAATAASKLLRSGLFSTLFTSHGVYADWGPPVLVANQLGVPAMTYLGSYLAEHFLFSWCSPRFIINPAAESRWLEMSQKPASALLLREMERFMIGRYQSNKAADMQGLIKSYRGDSSWIERLKLNRAKPVWGIMTHVTWDSAGDFFQMAHQSFDEWLSDTVRTISQLKECQWVIKIHPAEESSNPHSGARELIRSRFPDLPDHIRVLESTDDTNPLDFYSALNGLVTVSGTAGIECAYLGKPVILAGQPHYARRGFTFDASTIEEYHALLARAAHMSALTPAQKQLAESYAALYFLQAQIPFRLMTDDWRIDQQKLHRLQPGADPFIDFLCDCIIHKRDFVMDETLCALRADSLEERVCEQ